MRIRRSWPLLVLLVTLAGCDRNVEAFDPNEQPREPDLGRIFPEGAEAAPVVAGMPESPSGRRGAPPVAAAAAPVEGVVRLAESLDARIPDGATLFIVARTASAGPPLAVKRVEAPRFPLAFTLGPEDRMIQQMPFVGPFRISARIDADGNATSREAGDLQGVAPGSFEPGASGIEVVIDEVL